MKIKNIRKWYDYKVNFYKSQVAIFEAKDLNEIDNEINNILNGKPFRTYYSDIGSGILAPTHSKLLTKYREDNESVYIFQMVNHNLFVEWFEVIDKEKESNSIQDLEEFIKEYQICKVVIK